MLKIEVAPRQGVFSRKFQSGKMCTSVLPSGIGQQLRGPHEDKISVSSFFSSFDPCKATDDYLGWSRRSKLECMWIEKYELDQECVKSMDWSFRQVIY